MYYLLMKVRDEKEMKLIYFFFFIGKNTDKMVKYKGCYIKKVSKIRMLKHKNVRPGIFRTNLALFRHFYGPNLSLQLPRTRSR